MRTRVGTAGWAIPRAVAHRFPATGSGLERYSGCFDAAEVNTSFYRPHRRATYERWAASVPADFRFAVKLPREITHERRLVDCEAPVSRFGDEVRGLGDRRGPTLVQLPPSFVFDAALVARFLDALAPVLPGRTAWEPRHASWFTGEADALLAGHGAARVAADPALHPGADQPGGWRGLAYFRLHGSPRTYWSSYDAAALDDWRRRVEALARATEAWVIFDNTASGSAAANALEFQAG